MEEGGDSVERRHVGARSLCATRRGSVYISTARVCAAGNDSDFCSVAGAARGEEKRVAPRVDASMRAVSDAIDIVFEEVERDIRLGVLRDEADEVAQLEAPVVRLLSPLEMVAHAKASRPKSARRSRNSVARRRRVAGRDARPVCRGAERGRRHRGLESGSARHGAQENGTAPFRAEAPKAPLRCDACVVDALDNADTLRSDAACDDGGERSALVQRAVALVVEVVHAVWPHGATKARAASRAVVARVAPSGAPRVPRSPLARLEESRARCILLTTRIRGTLVALRRVACGAVIAILPRTGRFHRRKDQRRRIEGEYCTRSNALWNSDGDTAAIRERKRKHGAGGSIFRNNDSARHSSIRCHFHRLSVRSRLPLPSIGPSLHAHSVRLRL